MKKSVQVFVFILAMLAVSLAAAYNQSQPEPSFHPKDGFVPNAETAVRVAEAVLIPVYGEKQVLSERPFKATLEGDAWSVEGALHCGGAGKNCNGGTAVVKISKGSGQILLMAHYK